MESMEIPFFMIWEEKRKKVFGYKLYFLRLKFNANINRKRLCLLP